MQEHEKNYIKTQVLETLEKRGDHEIFILVHSNMSYIQFVKAT